MFQSRVLVIATMHDKEKVIAPFLEREIGVQCIIPPNFNSDVLGTFSGEMVRKLDPISTAREKCLMALKSTEYDLAVASEGSFGPHPTLFFVPADDEFLFFLDQKNGLEIVVRDLSTTTNFGSSEIKSEKELVEFAKTALFPSHGLILRKNRTDVKNIHKGISDWESLITIYNDLANSTPAVFVETDMRAMFNPTRMSIIENLTKKLVTKLKSNCPSCKTPGFDVTEVVKGLPCEWCHLPTNTTLKHLYVCKKCSFTKEVAFPNGIQFEDPMYCNNCNP